MKKRLLVFVVGLLLAGLWPVREYCSLADGSCTQSIQAGEFQTVSKQTQPMIIVLLESILHKELPIYYHHTFTDIHIDI